MPVPAVSVVMPVRDGKAFLDGAIRSILAQTFGDFEFLIVDDGSSDSTPEILRRHAAADPRIRVMTQAPAGIVAALNRGIDAASAPLIARMDADDVSLPSRLQHQVEALARHPTVVAIGSNYDVIDRAGRVRRTVRLPSDAAEIRERLKIACCIAHPTVLMRRSAVLGVGGYRPAFLLCEDHDLWLRLSERHDLANIDESLLLYREHGGQLTWNQLEQRFLSELAARLSARRRHAGKADLGDGAGPITRRQLREFGLSDVEIAGWLVTRALDTAREANRAGNRRVSWRAFGLARREQRLTWPVRLRFWRACFGNIP